MTEELANRSIIDAAIEQWRRRKWLLIVCFLSVFSVIVSLALALPPLYRSSTTILFGQDNITESLVKTGVENELELRLGIIQQAVLSRGQLQEMVDAFDLYAPMKKHDPPESIINRLRKDIKIEQRASAQPQWGKDSTYAITISYQGWDPDLVAKVANDLAARFKSENERIRINRAARTTQFINEQLDEAKKQFMAQENRINTFRNEHLGGLPEQQLVNMATLERLNAELQLNGEKQVQLLNRRDSMLFGVNASGQASSAAGLTGSLRLERLKRDLAEMQNRYTDNYPGIIRLKSEINTLEQELAEKGETGAKNDDLQLSGQNPADIDRELMALKKTERNLRNSIAALTRKIEEVPKIDQQLKRFTYDYDTSKDEYLALRKLYQDAQLAQSLETQQDQQFKIIEVAIPPNFPVAPDRFRLMFIGFIFAAGFAGAVLLLVEQLDRSFHSISDIRRFTRIPVLASVARIQTRGDRWRRMTRFGLVSILVVAGLVVVTSFSYYAGKNAEQLVWTISG